MTLGDATCRRLFLFLHLQVAAGADNFAERQPMRDVMATETSTSNKPGLKTIYGVFGAISGVVAAIFGAGIYYAQLTAKLEEYVKKIDANEKAIQSLNADLVAAKGSISALTAFNAALVRGVGEKSQQSGTVCPDGTYAVGLRALSESGLEHGAIYAINIDCRKFANAQ